MEVWVDIKNLKISWVDIVTNMEVEWRFISEGRHTLMNTFYAIKDFLKLPLKTTLKRIMYQVGRESSNIPSYITFTVQSKRSWPQLGPNGNPQFERNKSRLVTRVNE